PVTILGEDVTGNALDYNEYYQIMEPILDGFNNDKPQGLSFIIEGIQTGSNLYDVGIQNINAPETGVNLGSAETVIVTLRNFGTDVIAGIPYEIVLSGPTGTDTLMGIYNNAIAPGEFVEVTLNETVNLSEYGDYTFTACTTLDGDNYPDNDCFAKPVTNEEPFPCTDSLYLQGITADNPYGVHYWEIGGEYIFVSPNTSYPTWYHDFTDIVYNVYMGEPCVIGIGAEAGYEYFDVWIDYNDDAVFTNDELVVDDGYLENNYYIIGGPWIYDFPVSFDSPVVQLGEHYMRCRTKDWALVEDACEVSWQRGNCLDFKINIQLRTNDVSTLSLDMLGFYPPETVVAPVATIKNYGSAAQTFNVTLTIGAYSSTKTITLLNSMETINVAFDEWTAPEGDFTATVCTSLEGDEYAANDCKSLSVGVHSGDFIYAFCTSDHTGTLKRGTVTFELDNPGQVYQISPSKLENDFISGGCWADGTWYGCTYYEGGIYSISNKTGDMQLVYNTPSLNALAYDGSVFYAASNDKLYEINPDNGSCTLIGSFGILYPMLGMGCNSKGELFGYTAGNEEPSILYKINKNTGALSFVANLSFGLIYAQDMEFDKNFDVCYITAYNSEFSGLCTVNIETGQTTLIDYFENMVEITGFAIPYLPDLVPPSTEIIKEEFILMPNPTQGLVTITGADLREITIT
ncbi:MAG: hypothetical protein V1904_01150, partial [Bacteroidota bacterium]